MEKTDSSGSVHLSDDPLTESQAARRQCGGGVWWERSSEQAHLYVWLPSAKRSATSALINSEERSQSFFSPHSSTHGLAMTFTSFEAKSGSRYSDLQ